MNMDNSEAASGTGKRKARASSKKSDTGSIVPEVDLSVLTRLLDGVSDNSGAAILDALKQSPAEIDPLTNRIVNSRAIEQRKKLAQTIDTMESGQIEADFAYVGLPEDAQVMDFKLAYDVHLRTRLDKCAGGFAVIFDRLAKHLRPLIIETGCLHVPVNWAGDG